MADRRRKNRRRGPKPKPVDLWRPVPQLDPPDPIRAGDDPEVVLAMMRSLGAPNLPAVGALGEKNFQLVAHKAAGLATALAAAADLLEN